MISPRVAFVIGGAQKCGTSALSTYLSSHPQISLPKVKEAHVFDAPDFDDSWRADQVDGRYAAHFAGADAAMLYGDDTPIYMFLPCCIERIARYNPAMRWILLLRDPAERAVSHYYMERGRRQERLPLLVAMLLERWRLRAHWLDLGLQSPLRRHSYRARGDYAHQLDALYARFPIDQVLVLRSETLMADAAATLSRIYGFLGVDDCASSQPPVKVFVGEYPPLARNGFTMRCLRWLMRNERRAMREHYGIAFD